MMASEKRKPSKEELALLYQILPEGKPAYSQMRRRLGELDIIGFGRFGPHNLIFGYPEDEPDPTLPSAPVFSYGEIVSGKEMVEVTIHEENENKIETEIIRRTGEPGSKARVITIADFSPFSSAGEWGMFTKLELIKDRFYLSFLIEVKKIILTDLSSGYNMLIPVSNFYNELMFVKNIRNPAIALKPQLFFGEINKYSQSELKEAFLHYNKLFRRLKLDIPPEERNPRVSNGFFSKFFKGKIL